MLGFRQNSVSWMSKIRQNIWSRVLRSDDPMHFLWRCYYPARFEESNERCNFGTPYGGGMYQITAMLVNTLHRVRFEYGMRSEIRAHLADRGGGGSRER